MIPNSIRCIVAAGMIALAGGVRAQTCAAPLPLAANDTVYGSTCGGLKLADAFCDGTVNPGPNTVYRFSLAETSTVEFALGSMSPPFDPAMYVSDSDCASNRCAIALRPAQIMPPGDYWIIVGASSPSSEGSCGNFILSNLVTPVAADTIFSATFD